MKKTVLAVLLVFSCILSFPAVSLGTVIYQEGFELNDGGYTHSGASDTWQWGAPSGSVWPYAAATGINCWGTNLYGNYSAYSNATLYSPWIDLTAYSPGTTITLKWKQATDLETGWDYMSCYGETDAAESVSLLSTDARNEGWTEKVSDISFAAGKMFRVSWNLYSDFVIQYSGVYIDDVTIEIPVNKASTPFPEDGGLGVTVDPTLSWVHSGDVSFDVYFGTESNDLPLVAGGLDEMSYALSGLDNSTTYYWRVDVRSGDLGVSGDVWSFTTEEGGCIIPIPGGGGSGGCNAAGLGFLGLVMLAPLGLLRRKSR